MSQDKNSAYAAAEGREFLRGELKDKENEYVREFAGLIDDRETLDLLNYYCSLWRDKDERFLETRMGKIIVRNASTRMMDEAFKIGNTSQMKGVVGLTNNQGDSDEALTEIARRLTDEGCICLIVGPPGSGKTALMADITRVWGALSGGRVVSNLDWEGADDHVTTDREMFEAMAAQPDATLGALDELSQDLTGRGSDAKNAAEFARSLTLVRKQEEKHGAHAKRGSVVGVAHTLKRTAASVRRMATLIVQKPSRADPGKVRLLESEGGADNFEEIGEYQGLTDTREKYNQHEASAFDVEMDDDGDDGQDAPDADDIRRQEAIRTVVKACQPWHEDSGASYPDAADLVDYSDSWVGDRVRDWKDGQYRDLVSAPDDGSA